jgi:hypothetical protein
LRVADAGQNCITKVESRPAAVTLRCLIGGIVRLGEVYRVGGHLGRRAFAYHLGDRNL